MGNSFTLFGINFTSNDYNKIIAKLKNGSFMVVPSAPGLATIRKDLRYAQAVENADFAIPDSTYMVLLLKFLKGLRVNKFSGYNFLKKFIFFEKFNRNDLFLIDPSEKESRGNNKFLNNIGIPINLTYHYVAPIYEKKEKLYDSKLLDILNTLDVKPKYIMINLGSNIQEPLGYFLKKNIDYNVGIICTGAAISFITGSQASIPRFIDRYGLGWLWRCLENPFIYVPRYFNALNLIKLIYKEEVIINSK